jgi:hypothetical protein
MSCLGPNTNANKEILNEKVLLAAGEDKGEVLSAITKSNKLLDFHVYRGYSFFKFQNFTLIISPIGTGSLEPLLFEILEPGIVKEIILAGTVGLLPESNKKVSEIYAITESYEAGTALDEKNINFPLKPRWEKSIIQKSAIGVSTDYYYHFNYSFRDRLIDTKNFRLLKAMESVSKICDVVDMEVCQFYYFCSYYDNLNYLAVKGVTNNLGCREEHSNNSSKTVVNAVKIGMDLLMEND